MGPTGVGKTTVIHELARIDNRFVYIKPWTTRALRDGESDKIQVTADEIAEASARGDMIAVNELYGALYATPALTIRHAIADGANPIIDWPVAKASNLSASFPDVAIFRCYLFPPSL